MSQEIDISGRHELSGVSIIDVPNCGWNEEETFTGYVFTLDGAHYAAVENPDDGYRSYMDELQIVDTPPTASFTPQPVIVESVGDFWEIKCAISGKLVLRCGTDYADDYYPVCVIEYIPENLHINQPIMVQARTGKRRRSIEL